MLGCVMLYHVMLCCVYAIDTEVSHSSHCLIAPKTPVRYSVRCYGALQLRRYDIKPVEPNGLFDHSQRAKLNSVVSAESHTQLHSSVSTWAVQQQALGLRFLPSAFMFLMFGPPALERLK